ncbi:hypothetical protein SAMN05518861_13126 [Mesorhizobium sp. YR577]|nr:hypothetical protein SAMN05518861_13126 [Mesorhizobium sp. YR577]
MPPQRGGDFTALCLKTARFCLLEILDERDSRASLAVSFQ